MTGRQPAVTLIRLRPVEVFGEALQLPLWGGIGEDGSAAGPPCAGRGFRVLLGPEGGAGVAGAQRGPGGLPKASPSRAG